MTTGDFGETSPGSTGEARLTLSDELMIRWSVFRGLEFELSISEGEVASDTLTEHVAETVRMYQRGLEAVNRPINNDDLLKFGFTDNVTEAEIGRIVFTPGYELRLRDLLFMKFPNRQAIFYIEDEAALFLHGERIWDLRNDRDRNSAQTRFWEVGIDEELTAVTIGQPWLLGSYVEFPAISGVELRVFGVNKDQMNENVSPMPDYGVSPFFMARHICNLIQSGSL